MLFRSVAYNIRRKYFTEGELDSVMNYQGGRFPKSITANTDTTNHAICVNVMGNGSLKSLME